MFSLKVVNRFAPFSHTPGGRCLLPGTHLVVQVYPTRLHLFHESQIIELPLDVIGPVEGFTMMLDLEKGGIKLSGHAQDGFYHYLLCRKGKAIVLEGKGESQEVLFVKTSQLMRPHERLSLGCHRNQDWERMVRKRDLNELFPFWLRAAQWMPPVHVDAKGGSYALVNQAKEVITSRDRVGLKKAFDRLFHVAFSGMFCPQIADVNYLGYDLPTHDEASPLPLLSETGRLIRSLFFQETGCCFHFLPMPPPTMHCGRYVGLETQAGDKIDFEWSKKQLRRLVITPKASRTMNLHLQKGLESYRLRFHRKDRGRVVEANEKLSLEANTPVYLDRFQR